MRQSPEIAKLAAALAKAQAKIQVAVADETASIPLKSGGKYQYQYADLATVMDACRAALTSEGIAVVQVPSAAIEMRPGPPPFSVARVTVTTRILHSSGEWIEDDLAMEAQNATPQAIGSAITYARRYALAPMVGVVVGEDDDGHAATHGNQPQARTERNTPWPEPPKLWQTPEAKALNEYLASMGCQKEDGKIVCWHATSVVDWQVSTMDAAWINAVAVLEKVKEAVKHSMEIENLSEQDAKAAVLSVAREMWAGKP